MIGRVVFWGELRHRLTQNTHHWLRPAVVAGVLLASAVLAFFGTPRIFIAVVGLVVVVMAAIALLKWLPLGLLALVGSMLITYDGPSHLNVTMILVVVVFGVWLVDTIFNQRPLGLTASRTYYPLIGLALISLLAFGVGQLPWYPFARPAPLGAQAAGLSLFILSVLVYFLTSRQIKTVLWLQWLVGAFLVVGSLYILSELITPLQSFTNRLFSGYTTGSMFWTWLIALILGQAIFNSKLSSPARIALAAYALLILYRGMVLDQGWKSGWVPPLFSALTLVALWSWKLGALMVLGGGALAPRLITNLITTDEYSYATRLDAWRIVAEIIKVNPILGLGPANYRWYTPLFRIRGYAVQFNSHNQYVDIIAQIGILGLMVYLWFFAEVALLGWRLRQRVPEGFARAYVYSALAGVVGTLVAGMLGDWVIPFFYNITLGGFRASMLPWLFLGGLAALEQMEPEH